MRTLRLFALLAAGAGLCTSPSFSQVSPSHDSQSIADAARQSRLQKQQKDAQAQGAVNATDPQSAKAPHVITNDEIPEHVESSLTRDDAQAKEPGYALPNYGTQKTSADQWKAQILAQKNAIASLEQQIKSVGDSIHFPEHCLRNCAQRDERQVQKQDQVESMNQQLEQRKQRLQELQESARRQGFGSAVYDP